MLIHTLYSSDKACINHKRVSFLCVTLDNVKVIILSHYSSEDTESGVYCLTHLDDVYYAYHNITMTSSFNVSMKIYSLTFSSLHFVICSHNFIII